jgi:hypothetical protein
MHEDGKYLVMDRLAFVQMKNRIGDVNNNIFLEARASLKAGLSLTESVSHSVTLYQIAIT